MDLRKTIIGPGCRERFLASRILHLHLPEVLLAGVSDLQPPYRMWRPRPGFDLLLATVDGRGELTIDETHTALDAGGRLHLHAHKVQQYGIAGPTWRIAWCHLRPGTLATDGPAWQPAAGPDPFATTLEALVLESLRPDGGDPGTVAALATALRRIIMRAGDQQHGPLRELIAAMRLDPGADWSIARLTAELQRSPAQVRRIFHAACGCAPSAFVTRARMDLAVALLTRGDLSVAAVAEAVGYRNPFAFSTAFKRHSGHPPSRIASAGID